MIDYMSVQLKEKTGNSVFGSDKAMMVIILLVQTEATEVEWTLNSYLRLAYSLLLLLKLTRYQHGSILE